MDLTQPEIQTENCPLCGQLPGDLSVNTGRQGKFPAAFDELVPVGVSFSSQGQSSQFRRCPNCGAYFVWEECPQMYGSGDNDEERLIRLSAKASRLLNNLFAADPKAGLAPAEVSEYFEALSPDELRGALQSLVGEAPNVVTPFVPKLVGLLGKSDDTWIKYPINNLLNDYASGSAKRTAEVEAAQAEYAFRIMEKHFARAGAVLKHNGAPQQWSHFCTLFYLNTIEFLERGMQTRLLMGLLAELVDFMQAFSGSDFTDKLYYLLRDFSRYAWLEPLLPESAKLKISVMEEMRLQHEDEAERFRLDQLSY